MLGVFPLPPPYTGYVAPINMISSIGDCSIISYDPWVIANPLEFDSFGLSMSLFLHELPYFMIQSIKVDSDSGGQLLVELDQYSLASWDVSPSNSYDFLDHVMP